MKHLTPLMNPIEFVPAGRRHLLARYNEELAQLNRGVNLVARSSVSRIMEDHVMHCLTLAVRPFPPGSRIVDWGSGGGLPAIPLAICFPDVEFVAVDSLSKKTEAVRIMARRLGLDNVLPWNGRAENWNEPIYGAVSRATADLESLWRWTRRLLIPDPAVAPIESVGEVMETGTSDMTGASEREFWSSGLVCLKGGDLVAEVAATKRRFPGVRIEARTLATEFDRPDWEEKYILTVTDESAGGQALDRAG